MKKRIGYRFRRNARYLKMLRDARSTPSRVKLLKKANPNQIFAIMDAANNILNGNFSITTRQKQRLIPYREQVRQLSRARSVNNARKVIQYGNGAFLPALLAPIIAELGVFAVREIVKAIQKK